MSSVGNAPSGADKVGVIFGGPSPEHDVSILTGLQAARALVTAGRGAGGVEAIYWTKGERFVSVDPTLEASAFVDGPPKGARDLRFVAQPGGGFFSSKGGVLGGGKERRLELEALVNCCHGGPGEDGTLQAALDMAGVPYTGPTVASAALCMDKLGFGSVAMAAGLPTLPRTLVLPGSDAPAWEGVDGPYIVKPRFGGSSIGIEVINGWADVLRYVELGGPHTQQGVIAEPFHEDAADVQVSVRSYPALALSLFERPLRTGTSTQNPFVLGQISRGRGDGQFSPRGARQACYWSRKGTAGGRINDRPAGRRPGGVASGLPGGTGRRELVVERGEHCAWLVRQISLGGRGRR